MTFYFDCLFIESLVGGGRCLNGIFVRFILNKINFCNKHPIIIQMLYFSNSNLIKFSVLYTLYMYNTDVLYLIISDWEDEPTPKKPKISKSKSTPSSKKGMTVVLKMGNGNDEKSTIQ